MVVQFIFEGYYSVILYLSIKGVVCVIDFYKQVFGVIEIMCMNGFNGIIVYVEICIGNLFIMLVDEMLNMICVSFDMLQSMLVGMMIYVFNVDIVFVNVLKVGGMEVCFVVDQFYGDCFGIFKDLFGYVWIVFMYVEDVVFDEMVKCMEKWMKEQVVVLV